jgi:diaminohydroxyphosphoribosylaminopyrimidine deaminase / 5-amino-6-(5-phosphoribosylamino)uracil reductase
MDRALDLALRGWGRVAPNPMVGAVLLRDGMIVSEGFHAEYGAPHAEAAALAACTHPEGTTCVVNLEPCGHQGKTPPCADALIAAKVHRVVMAVRDPHGEARGGADRLRAAGIEVEVGLRAQVAAALNASFLWNVARPARPFVALKLATSIDGCIADADGKSRWISGPVAREYVQWLRAGYQAVAVGARTALADDPQLTVRGTVLPRIPPTRILFLRSTPVPPSMKMLRSGATSTS